MELRDLLREAQEVQALYRVSNRSRGYMEWGVAEYAQGLVGDVGDLMKLIMAKQGLREGSDIERKLAHELSDCLWSLLIIAEELGIDLEKAFLHNMEELKRRSAR